MWKRIQKRVLRIVVERAKAKLAKLEHEEALDSLPFNAELARSGTIAEGRTRWHVMKGVKPECGGKIVAPIYKRLAVHRGDMEPLGVCRNCISVLEMREAQW
jgi:hypothetical protein